jgi:predicted RNase H-like nuclease
MRVLCGVDGCRQGWVAISRDLDTGLISCAQFPSIVDLFHSKPQPLVIAIDIPIGLLDLGSRRCDLEARRLLGSPRLSSVFPAPIRPLLQVPDYQRAAALRFSLEGRKVSRQAWGIVPKIREVDAVLQAEAAARSAFFEIHPEISFFHMMGGRPMPHTKKSPAGHAERLDVLRSEFGEAVTSALAARRQLRCLPDDVLDAFAALWSAQRIFDGRSITLPSDPPLDSLGLPMRIVA